MNRGISMLYDYIMLSHAQEKNTRYHQKKSELTTTYNNIVKLNRNTPLYFAKPTITNQQFALSLKETALSFQNLLDGFYSENPDSVFSRKTPVSSDPSSITVGTTTEDSSVFPESCSIQVDKLACPQINLGRSCYAASHFPNAGTFRFSLSLEDSDYTYQINVPKNCEHGKLLSQLASAINHSDAAVHAAIVKDPKNSDKIQLQIHSDSTGILEDNAPIFTFSDDKDSDKSGLIAYYDLNHIATRPDNAYFKINEEEKTSLNNTITLSNALKVTFKNITKEPINISYKADIKAITSMLSHLADTYNSWVDLALEDSTPKNVSAKLLHTLSSPFSHNLDTLSECGITFDEQNYMHLHPALNKKAALDGSLQKLFAKDTPLFAQMSKITKKFILDPMSYADRILITYKNPIKNYFPNPYITSAYSGMLVNFCC